MNTESLRKKAVAIGFLVSVIIFFIMFFGILESGLPKQDVLSKLKLNPLGIWIGLILIIVGGIIMPFMFYWKAWFGKFSSIPYFWLTYSLALVCAFLDLSPNIDSLPSRTFGIVMVLSAITCAADGVAFTLILLESKKQDSLQSISIH